MLDAFSDSCRFLRYLPYKCCGVHDLNAMEVLERSEVGIPGNYIVRLSFQSTSKKFIVGRVLGERVRFIGVSRNDSFSGNKPKEPSDVFLFWMKPLSDPGIPEDPGNLFQDFQGNNQFKLLPYPEILKSCGQGIPGEDAADKKVGIYHGWPLPFLQLREPHKRCPLSLRQSNL